jgi:hypothetical protein
MHKDKNKKKSSSKKEEEKQLALHESIWSKGLLQ